MQIKITRAKKLPTQNSWNLEMKDITAGMILAMYYALDMYKSSPVAEDCRCFLEHAIKENEELLTYLGGKL